MESVGIFSVNVGDGYIYAYARAYANVDKCKRRHSADKCIQAANTQRGRKGAVVARQFECVDRMIIRVQFFRIFWSIPIESDYPRRNVPGNLERRDEMLNYSYYYVKTIAEGGQPPKTYKFAKG